ncbi:MULTISPECIES: helix-turn-helix domain-containing protein [unclassified Mucilaginibacter]|uniref:helix-turn-helix domain-containing protein n=1 Tax=unclassified Mucilaginibacter TaxID=2617802 RepID=UPI00095F1C2B|nr:MULTISPECIES: AraC family transcriptional regulator [unclassified Mucilaginibacter]OJW17414.1 MAG: transcriptional regulator [Mucilaginibacter sp. 44-25]PLW90630.1 MAG: transcriptional regulator [Mucilaginibacter sp.]PMP65958.1 MAG: transcriptional regulator [Mucilaginibacter sp.]HEK19225.1 AraC family transcriptional regulator [Bacteroidota bacterium]
MKTDFIFNFLEPEPAISAFVENIGMFHNQSDTAKEVVVLPDGRIDLFFWQPGTQAYEVLLIGLETAPEQRFVPPQAKAFVVSFKPPAVEYILKTRVADIIDIAKNFPENYWGFDKDILTDFDLFYRRVSAKIKALIPLSPDRRKLKLFDLIYKTNGEMPVAELAEQVGWSSRQINRYFNQQYGLSLKAYCNILRFRASLKHIAKGKLFPELNFTDQAYFIKEVKKFSGVLPKELSRNKNDRFILLSVLKEQ